MERVDLIKPNFPLSKFWKNFDFPWGSFTAPQCGHFIGFCGGGSYSNSKLIIFNSSGTE